MQTPPSEPSARSGKLLAKLRLSLTVLVVLLFLLEGAVRSRQYLRYGTFGQIYEFTTDNEVGIPTPVPGQTTKTISINSLGFRGPELAPPSEEVLRIAFLGASTTFCAEVSSNEATWPSLVVDALNERFAPQRFDYVNGGVAGYTLNQSLKNLTHRVAPHEPNVIVIYHATNDITRNSRPLAKEQGVYSGHADESSWLGKFSLTWYLVRKNLLQRARTQAAREDSGRLEVNVDQLAQPFRQDLIRLTEAAKTHAERVCLITFSQRARPGQSAEELLASCASSLYYMPYMTPDGLLASFAAYNTVIREVAASSGSLLIEAAESVPADGTHFSDSVHLTDAGARILAETVFGGLSGDPAFKALFAE